MMQAMLLTAIANLAENSTPLQLATDLPEPIPGPRDLVVQVSTCGICHTDLDEIEGRTPPARLPMVLGHQIVGRVKAIGPEVRQFKTGDRVGIAWIHSACGTCQACRSGEENLCARFEATGRDAPGGYAEQTLVAEAFAHRIPEAFSDAEAAPLLCAGAVGYRSLRLTGMANGRTLGLVGFGASAHLVIQLVRYLYPEAKIFVFSRSAAEQQFAKELGATWVGALEATPPERMDCAIDTTPAWGPIVHTLGRLAPGGRLVINAIRKEGGDKAALLQLDYATHLWMEKELKSVANVSRQDVRDFLEVAVAIPIKPAIQEFRLEEANEALREIRERKIRGAKVLRIAP